jgi:hypothetical protein
MAQTDNSYLADKAALRIGSLPDKSPVRVLDCYAGDGKVWAAVRKLSGKKIDILPIDIRQDIGFGLPGDNRIYLSSLDLSRFDIIDLDAYGIPYEQLKIIFERNYRGIVFVTFIQSLYGMVSGGILEDIGYPPAMVNKIPTIFNRSGWDHFLQWLALNGVERIKHRSSASRKHYLCFSI